MCKLPVRLPCLIRNEGSVLMCRRGENHLGVIGGIERGAKHTDHRIWLAALAPLALESAHGPAGGHRAARTMLEGDIRPSHPGKKGPRA